MVRVDCSICRHSTEEASMHNALTKILWWLCLLVAPLVLAVIEMFHPANFTSTPGMYQYLSTPQPYNPTHQALAYWGPDWWFALHMIQTPMVALVAIGLWPGEDDPQHTITRKSGRTYCQSGKRRRARSQQDVG
jgi:hypothetical protein